MGEEQGAAWGEGLVREGGEWPGGWFGGGVAWFERFGSKGNK